MSSAVRPGDDVQIVSPERADLHMIGNWRETRR